MVQSVQVFRHVDNLSVSWKPGPGRAEQFQILLRDSTGPGSAWNATLDNVTTSYTMNGLTPGRMYNMSIVTEVAGMQNAVSMQEQTGMDLFYHERTLEIIRNISNKTKSRTMSSISWLLHGEER